LVQFKEVPLSEGFEVEKIGACVKYGEYPVYFMLIKRGQAIEIHISAKGRAGKLKLREAAKAVIDWIPKQYPACEMIIATVASKSVYNLCTKIGFIDCGQANFERGLANIMVIKLWDL